MQYSIALALALLTLVTSAMDKLAPKRNHTVLANAIASVVSAQPPLFKGDSDRKHTAALVIAVAFRESSLDPAALGDYDAKGKPHSFCAMQIHDTAGGTVALTTDAEACVAKGLAMLRSSVRVDPAHPVAWYARGPGYRSRTAVRISNDRMWLARKVLAGWP